MTARQGDPPPGSDPLTGLATRLGLRDRLGVLLAEGTDAALAVLRVDLDRFRAVNESLGRPMGDALLIKAAERLRGSVRAGDVVGRMGGNEFAILHVGLPGRVHAGQLGAPRSGGATDWAEDAAALASRLVALLGRPYPIGGRIINLGASVGVALAPMHGREPDELLRRAGLALHRAKTRGGGTHRFFEPASDEHREA